MRKLRKNEFFFSPFLSVNIWNQLKIDDQKVQEKLAIICETALILKPDLALISS